MRTKSKLLPVDELTDDRLFERMCGFIAIEAPADRKVNMMKNVWFAKANPSQGVNVILSLPHHFTTLEQQGAAENIANEITRRIIARIEREQTDWSEL